MNGGSACHVIGNPIKTRVNIIRSAPKRILMVADKTEPLIGSQPVALVQAERLELLPVVVWTTPEYLYSLSSPSLCQQSDSEFFVLQDTAINI